MTQDPSGGRADGEGRWIAREHPDDGAAVGVERVATWAEETRRYRRNPGGWWWLALLLVPAILAALSVAMSDDAGAKKAGESPSSATVAAAGTSARMSASAAGSSSAPNSAGASSATTPSDGKVGEVAVIAGAPFAISRTGDEVTVAAVVPDDASGAGLVGAVKATLGGGVTIIDKVTKSADILAPSAAAVSTALDALSKAGDFGVAWNMKALTTTGIVDSEGAKKAIGAALSTAWPEVGIQNDVTVGSSADTPCTNLAAKITVAFAGTNVTFVRDSTAVGPEDVGRIKKVAALLVGCPDATVTVSGYTDSSGSKAENLALSKGRAAMVGKILTSNGVASDRITIKGLADTDPVMKDSEPGGRNANRRITITVN